jgi:vacuolar-type H+-ATPase subunit E/Vma4
MSAEKIINQIKKDSEKEVKKIISNANKQADIIIKNLIDKAKQESNLILKNGMNHSDSIKKILISKANQDIKRKITKERENIIEQCFEKAKEKLTNLNDKEYEKLVKKLINQGCRKLDGECTVKISKNIDKKISNKLGIKVSGKTDSIGGIICISKNGKKILDNTFNGILKREKDKIRIKVGKILFS